MHAPKTVNLKTLDFFTEKKEFLFIYIFFDQKRLFKIDLLNGLYVIEREKFILMTLNRRA